ncbi:MAG TPA: hypothetical protein VLT82_18680 [Myxococcaceae bacterium]|nr:hypothetical protein [Myxococcaceae bacterium]
MCSRFLIRISAPLTTVLVAVIVGLAGAARAQVANNCPNYANGNKGAFCINGSDTWFDVMTDAIKRKVAEDKAAGCNQTPPAPTCIAPAILQPPGDLAPGESALFYNGTGSGNGANSMKLGAPSGGGAITGLGSQSIAPMSRNFRPNESCQTGNPNCGSQIQGQFPLWQPQIPNVGGLDAAVIVSRNQASRFTNLALPLFPTDSTRANPNNTALGCTFGSPGGGANCYDQVLEVVLSGVDGSGSTSACADPKRVQAIADFSRRFGGTLRHLYRRDENSGTTDTFKDKIAVQRFCNGGAVGVLGANKTHPNLNNQDLDPVRRPCDNPIPGVREQVTCTDTSTGAACTSDPARADFSANCTQGFITALSENDSGITDITVTIANRAGSDASGLTVGYAGREAIRLPAGTTAGPSINTNPPTDALVRQDVYLLARRLFLQRGPALPAFDSTANEAATFVRTTAAGGACPDPGGCRERVTNDGPTGTIACPDGNTDGAGGTANLCKGGGSKQRDFEDALFLWMTDTTGGGSQLGRSGRRNLDPIMSARGFLPCTSNFSPPSGSSNLCSKTPYPTISSTPAACLPFASSGGPGWNYAQVGCTGSSVCCSNGLACNAQPAGTPANTCAAATGRPINSACSFDGLQAECAGGLTCTDIGSGLLACQ